MSHVNQEQELVLSWGSFGLTKNGHQLYSDSNLNVWGSDRDSQNVNVRSLIIGGSWCLSVGATLKFKQLKDGGSMLVQAK